jgi:hypothetical protein
MPTLLVLNGYQFYFFSNEGEEPPHIHVDKADATMKVWLDTLEIAYNYGYNPKQVKFILKAIQEHKESFINGWNSFFS